VWVRVVQDEGESVMVATTDNVWEWVREGVKVGERLDN
jgi:hypothetical protein